MIKLFELEATFRAEPPQEPQPANFYVRGETAESAIASLQSQGGYNVRVIRELSEEESRHFRYLKSAEL